jgi:hypothetical protein
MPLVKVQEAPARQLAAKFEERGLEPELAGLETGGWSNDGEVSGCSNGSGTCIVEGGRAKINV